MARIVLIQDKKYLIGRQAEGEPFMGRVKQHHDLLTGEVVAVGPNEYYKQEDRDYDKAPLTEGEMRQRGKWSEACRLGHLIAHDRNHPRFREFHSAWRAQLNNPPDPVTGKGPYKCLSNFISVQLLKEMA